MSAIDANDRLDIADALYRYARAVDMIGATPLAPEQTDIGLGHAKVLLATCMTEDVRVRLFFNGPDGDAVDAGTGGVDQFGDFVRSYFTDYGYVQTYHLVGNVRITGLEAGVAEVLSYINSNHWMADGRILLAPIEYHDRVVKGGEGVWRIQTRDILVWTWWVSEGYFPLPTDPQLGRRPVS